MRRVSLLLVCALASAACQAPGGARQTAVAAEEWVRTYSLTPDGDLGITNTNGEIEIEGTAAAMVEVRAERIAHATTDAAARDLLPHIVIHDESGAGRVAIQTEQIPGVMIGASVEVIYHVKAPASARVRARTVNGSIIVTGATGGLVVSTVNGEIIGKSLAGGIDARTVNKSVTIDVVAVGSEPIDVRTVSGSIDLAVPSETNANLTATCANGSIGVAGLTFQTLGEQSRRRTRGRINGGGTPIELNAVNGDIHVHERR